MAIAENITELIGNTPLLLLNRLSDETGASIYGKLESQNPLSSVKDRIALNMIEQAEKSGKLKPGSLIIEPTSGNTGIGLAFVAASKGYRLLLVMPDSMSIERRKIMKVLGAEIILTPGKDGMNGAVTRAEELQKENPGSFIPGQFTNSANPEVHRLTTAEEIWNDLGDSIDIFVAGVGTGGTITGVGEVLKERKASITVYAVEPKGSPVLSGGKPGLHKIQGIGPGFVPAILNTSIYDEVIQIENEEAAEMARHLARTEGVLVGISSGANVLAAKKLALRPANKGKRIVTMLCDSGERYLSTWIFGQE